MILYVWIEVVIEVFECFVSDDFLVLVKMYVVSVVYGVVVIWDEFFCDVCMGKV